MGDENEGECGDGEKNKYVSQVKVPFGVKTEK